MHTNKIDEKKNIKPDVIGIGAQKAATSWLFFCLDEHPQICGVKSKEVHFFSYPDRYQKGYVWYESLFNHCGNDLLRVEISTSYLSSKKALERIAEAYPDVKILVSLRDPVDRTLSHIEHLKSKGMIKEEQELEEIIKRYPEVIENSLYGKHMENVFNFFDKNRVHVIWYGDIKSKPKSVIQGTYRFLGIDDRYVPNALRQKVNSAELRSSKLFKKLQKLNRRLSRFVMFRIIFNYLRKLGLRGHLLGEILPKKRKSLSADAATLKKYFKEDTRKLENLLAQNTVTN